jgi:hypothetical protein
VQGSAISDAELFGLSDAQKSDLHAALSQNDDEYDGVWPDNELVTIAFLLSTTQWRVAVGMGGVAYLGFDYPGVQAGLTASGIEITPELWMDLRVMEIAAIDLMNARPS